MNFIISNLENFQTNSSTYYINARYKHYLHRPNANMAFFQKNTFYAGIRICKSLPSRLTILKNGKTKFKAALKENTYIHAPFTLFVSGQSLILFCKMFIVFHTVKIVYICVFMTCSYPTVFVTHLRIHGMYVHLYVCVCVCVCVRANACVDTNINSDTEIHNEQSNVNISLQSCCVIKH